MMGSSGGNSVEYTIKKLASMAGVSTRTLRYYDEIGLLRPKRINTSGYRIYGASEVDQLQQILFFRALGLELGVIADLLQSPSFDRPRALEGHLEELKERKRQLDLLIRNVESTIKNEKGEITMTDQDKFEGLKIELVRENERKYGGETRRLYGEDAVNMSNKQLLDMSEAAYREMENLGDRIKADLEKAVMHGILPDSEAGRDIVRAHKTWLMNTWKEYSPEAHKNLTEMYVSDERFTAYYDGAVKGCAVFLRDAAHAWAGCMNS